jgi:hypothetical protein
VRLEANLYRDIRGIFHLIFSKPAAVLSLNDTARPEERKEKRRKTDTGAACIKYLSLKPNLVTYSRDEMLAGARIKSKKLPASQVEVLFPGKYPGEAKVRILFRDSTAHLVFVLILVGENLSRLRRCTDNLGSSG